MNDRLPPVMRRALAPFAPPITRPVRTALVQVTTDEQPANDPTAAADAIEREIAEITEADWLAADRAIAAKKNSDAWREGEIARAQEAELNQLRIEGRI